MWIRFLGTSAGELYPGLWCQCANCQAARNGGERDRRQSATLAVYPNGFPSPEDAPDSKGAETFSPLILIDFPPEIASQTARHRVDLTRLEHLLITHSHGDHYLPYPLRWRARPPIIADHPPTNLGAPRFTALPTLHIYGNAAVEAALRRELGADVSPYDILFHPTAAGDHFTTGATQVTALHANHDVGREEALNFVLRDASGTLLYGLDGDTFLPETRDALREFRFDAVILEATYGLGDGGNHRNFARLFSEADWLRAEGLLAPNGRILATHFSPHHCPPHAETQALLAAHGIETAWDGMEKEIGK